jgi:hypothetical protein
MTTMSGKMIASINSALLFLSDGEYEKPEMRPWQYVQMEYERVGLKPPQRIPDFESFEDAEIWMCLDSRYNNRLRETGFLRAV